ncbi:hypothetical protein GWI33_013634 [Rhynchophorus ferrugineus]|uniref:Uncharacterized protein n=1 Tax=Rhynchophorus ferrugineus TaxID=354439 RepID=A0A834IGP4_RHYFE|nr:hypothetical protein GWI33_013634 [Rhynchophorus ferrugineus]
MTRGALFPGSLVIGHVFLPTETKRELRMVAVDAPACFLQRRKIPPRPKQPLPHRPRLRNVIPFRPLGSIPHFPDPVPTPHTHLDNKEAPNGAPADAPVSRTPHHNTLTLPKQMRVGPPGRWPMLTGGGGSGETTRRKRGQTDAQFPPHRPFRANVYPHARISPPRRRSIEPQTRNAISRPRSPGLGQRGSRRSTEERALPSSWRGYHLRMNIVAEKANINQAARVRLSINPLPGTRGFQDQGQPATPTSFLTTPPLGGGSGDG